MRFRLLALAVVVIGAATWALVACPQPEPLAPPLETSTPAPDGIHFRVTRTVNRVPTRGDSVVLYGVLADGGFGQEVRAPLGEATFRVPNGDWRVARPGGARPSIVTITDATREVSIIGDEYLLSGRVLDASGAPVVGVAVECGGALVGTDQQGRFAALFDTDDELWVSLHDTQSSRQRVRPSGGPVELRVEP
jgi:hypothetical protein